MATLILHAGYDSRTVGAAHFRLGMIPREPFLSYRHENPPAADRFAPPRAPASIGAACAALAVLALNASPVAALDAPATESSAATAQAPSADSDEAETPDSTEQGQTQMTDSFEHRPVEALLHESTLVGLRDATTNVQLRTEFLNRDNFDETASETWALGGSAGLKTGYFVNFAAFGATGYTSQRLDGPLDKDGAKLLQPEQEQYSVMGELYGQFKLTDEILAVAGRRMFSTPFINAQDSLMTPNTFLLYDVQGLIQNTDDTSTLRFAAGYVDKMKPRNAQDFESMATAAGAPSGVERGVYVAGANYAAGGFAFGAIDYYSADIINIAYSEIKYAIPLARRVTLRFGAQYVDQHSTGNDLLTGKPFATNQYGLKAEIGFGGALLTAARSHTAIGDVSSNGSGTDMRNPWGAYPGYTAVQVENFYRAGENATLLRAAYNFPKRTNLSVYGLWVHGSTPTFKRSMRRASTTSTCNGMRRKAHCRGSSCACVMLISRRRARAMSTKMSCDCWFTTPCVKLTIDRHPHWCLPCL